MGAVTLILGGTKSGKSSYARDIALQRQKETEREEDRASQVLYIATARVLDEEMADRVQRHIESRPAQWRTWERSVRVGEGLQSESEGCCAVILDCLTMLATNIILDQEEGTPRDEIQQTVLEEVDTILQAAEEIDAELLIISNHVESGLISPNRLGRLFQDICGLCHQHIAAHADRVFLMTAGIPQQLK